MYRIKGTGGKNKFPWKRESHLTPPRTPPEFLFFQIIFSFSQYESLRDLSNISDSGMIKGAQNINVSDGGSPESCAGGLLAPFFSRSRP
jgi:hypothetical protein